MEDQPTPQMLRKKDAPQHVDHARLVQRKKACATLRLFSRLEGSVGKMDGGRLASRDEVRQAGRVEKCNNGKAG
jgi:hypothetical protein